MNFNPWQQGPATNMLTANQAAMIALQRVPGTVINVALTGENSESFYEVKIVTAQGRFTVMVNPFTGTITKIRRG